MDDTALIWSQEDGDAVICGSAFILCSSAMVVVVDKKHLILLAVYG